MERTPAAVSFLRATQLLGQSSTQLMFGTVVLNVLIAGAFARMAQWIASMQLIVHIPIMQVIVPANVSAYFEAVVPLFTFDFLPSEITTAYVFDFDDLG